MSALIPWLIKKMLTQALYKKVVVIIIDDGLGYLVKQTDNKLDDKLHAAVVEALKS